MTEQPKRIGSARLAFAYAMGVAPILKLMARDLIWTPLGAIVASLLVIGWIIAIVVLVRAARVMRKIAGLRRASGRIYGQIGDVYAEIKPIQGQVHAIQMKRVDVLKDQAALGGKMVELSRERSAIFREKADCWRNRRLLVGNDRPPLAPR